jgi:hypothetical protein
MSARRLATYRLLANDSRISEIPENVGKCASVNPPCPSGKAVYTTATTGTTRKVTRNAVIASAIATMPGWVLTSRDPHPDPLPREREKDAPLRLGDVVGSEVASP